ncbi:hypothetical protein FYK55_16245 [Roseiconus nitratireducens]|uniref:LssY-like C-terminal domain-containing protein n=1 Tax=Roseiconus nitratireducens TaxID=2605748 RepID=A0A5M6D4R8_9BACT|nr:LssY C-terminal domain-containing protein [Roseiconus nitratireducens]KAA5541766.1 hypothetical protein FYK55_16245 [Roseiconus nitratireducens]
MSEHSDNPSDPVVPARRDVLWQRISSALGILLLVYLVVAYWLMPVFWEHYTGRHPALDDMPGVTETSDGHPGDPINLALIGMEQELKAALRAAGWYTADPLGMRSDLRIAVDSVAERPYDAAPVSRLYLWGRPEDLAFEQPVGDDPRQRHHVRFWKSGQTDDQGNPLWAGSATFDRRVGLSHTTGQITHHIAADVDLERDHLVGELRQTGRLIDIEFVDDFHQVRQGRNGGGDPWHTDGRLSLAKLRITATD